MFLSTFIRLIFLPTIAPSVSVSTFRSFSTHTPYDYARGDVRDATWTTDLRPTKLYLLARHGSRHLGPSAVESMDKFIDKLLDNEGTVRLPWLQNWTRPEYVSDWHLVDQGMLEHYHLAKRYKERFLELFPPYYPSRYDIRATFRLRTSQSAASFMFGLFENMGPLDNSSSRENVSTEGFQPTAIEIESEDEDALLRFMENCPVYENSTITTTGATEVTKLQSSAKYKQLILDPISERLGLPVTAEDAEGLYELCNFEHVSPTESPDSHFCDVIPDTALELFDYESDLSRYYKSGYPNKLGYELSCVVLADVLKQFSDKSPVTTLRFAHSETIMPLIALLGIQKDKEVLYQWDKIDYPTRRTKLSELDPFAANLGFVVFENTTSGEEFIKAYLNEREVKLPPCASHQGCRRSELQAVVKGTLGGCDRSAMCFGSKPRSSAGHKPMTSSKDTDQVIMTTRDTAEEMLRKKLADKNVVLLDWGLFIVMTILSGLCVVLAGFVGLNWKRLLVSSEGYERMPFLE